jgi:uncharacterized alkaline shock family protein YloU
MSSDYVVVDNLNNAGTMGISRKALENIASLATNGVKGATVSKSRARLFNLSRPVYAYIRKDGRVEIHLDVNIKSGAQVKDVCLKIQEDVASAITMMCETVPFRIQIKVVSIK